MTLFPAARTLILNAAHPLGTETVTLGQLGGRVFAQDLLAPFDVPHFDNSQVDGYAVRASDEKRRRLVGESAAGMATVPSVGRGDAVRIFTGAPLPEGADAVIMQEDTVRMGENIVTDSEPRPGENVRRRGEEIRQGTRFELTGRRVTPPLVGLAASFGLSRLRVFRLPRVTIVATGNELVRVGESLGPGQVYASNSSAIAEAIRALGISEVQTAMVGDEREQTQAAFSEALRDSDVLITLGGVSVGDHDLVRSSLALIGVEERLWRVSMKPGKPFYFGTEGEKRVYGLPGNPVSALVTFQLLVRPAFRAMLGLTDAEEESTARLGASIVRGDLRYEFVRATLARGVATPVSAQGSHMQTGLAFADALIHVPDGVATIDEGQEVRITPLCWGT